MLDAAGRSARAKKASQAAAKERTEKLVLRNQLIRLAHAYLTSSGLSKADALKAIEFLQKQGLGVNLPAQTSAYTFLSRALGLTRQSIWAIVNKKTI